MKAKVYWLHWGSTVMAALALSFAGTALAAPIGGQLPDTVIHAGKTDVRASGQDPSTPPDCKQYPNDTRCQSKK